MSTHIPTGTTGPRRLGRDHGDPGEPGEPDSTVWGALGMVPDQIAEAAALRHAAERLARRAAAHDLEATEQEITRAVLAAVPAADHAGLTVLTGDGRLISAAPSGEIVARLDQAQAALHEGPCFGADDEADPSGLAAPPVRVADMLLEVGEDGRWPRFGLEALRNGIRSAVSVRVTGGPSESVALSVYATGPGEFGASAEAAVRVLVGRAATVRRASTQSTRQALALRERDLVGQAKGILMQRHRVGADVAHTRLVAAAAAAGIALPDVARWLVDDLAARARGPA